MTQTVLTDPKLHCNYNLFGQVGDQAVQFVLFRVRHCCPFLQIPDFITLFARP